MCRNHTVTDNRYCLLLPESVSRLSHPVVVFRQFKGVRPMLQHAFAWRTGDSNSPVMDFLKNFRRYTNSVPLDKKRRTTPELSP